MIDAMKDLLAKVPNAQELMAEAARPVERAWQETAYVFNGFDEVTVRYAGQPYHLPFGKVTAIHGKPQHKEIDQLASRDGYTKFQQLPLTGERIAREMIEGRGLTERGLVVLLTSTITKEAETAALELGYDYKMNKIESYKIGRDRAKSGQPGKMRPDKLVYKWMKQYSPDDEIFAQQSRRTDSQTTTADALKMLAENQKTMLEMQAKIARLEQGQTAGPAAEAAPALTPPRRKPLESDEALAKRTAQWKIDNNIE